MKKIIALLLALVMALSLVACGGSQAPATEAPATEAPKAEAPAATEAPAETVKVYDKPELSLTFPEINADAGTVCEMIRRFAFV